MGFLKGLALAALAALAPIHAVMITVGVLIMADLITGMMAARKRGEKITSAAMRRTVSKMVIYQTVVVTAFLVETYLLGGLIPASKLVASVIGMVELTSVLENANTITGKDLFTEVLKRLGSKNDDEK